jgi:DNA-binding CsgD family transcriptional regulator
MARNLAENSRRYRERHPERIRAANLARNDYKREWEAGECPQCGGVIADYRRSELCRPCRKEQNADEFKAKAQYFIERREEGLTNAEIERRDGLSHNTVAVHLYQAKKRFGITAPRCPYFKAPA